MLPPDVSVTEKNFDGSPHKQWPDLSDNSECTYIHIHGDRKTFI